MRRTRWLLVSALAVASVSVYFWMSTPDLEVLVRDDIQAISQGRPPGAIFNRYNAVCFEAGSGRLDLSIAARSSGLTIDASLDACGVEQSCCGIDSDVAGQVALVQDDTVKCVPIRRFLYLLDADKPFCVTPSQIKATEHKFLTRFNPPGRSYFTVIGQSYFQIGKQ